MGSMVQSTVGCFPKLCLFKFSVAAGGVAKAIYKQLCFSHLVPVPLVLLIINESVRNVLKVSELNHSVKEMAYQESLRVKYEMCRGGECGEGVGKVQRYGNEVYQ